MEQRFAGRILPLDAAALHAWAQIAAHSGLAGQPLLVMGGLLMATAQCHELTVVTRNVQDFACTRNCSILGHEFRPRARMADLLQQVAELSEPPHD